MPATDTIVATLDNRNRVAQTRWNILRAKSIMTNCQHRVVSSNHLTGVPFKRHGIGHEFIPAFNQAVGVVGIIILPEIILAPPNHPARWSSFAVLAANALNWPQGQKNQTNKQNTQRSEM